MWLEYVRALWPVVLGLAAFFSGVVGLWLASKFASKADVQTITAKHQANDLVIAGLDGRLKHIETQLESAPTRQELQDDISKLAERMSGMEAGFKGVSKQLTTTNDYLHTLIENAIKPGGNR